jgi:HSP20 family protein
MYDERAAGDPFGTQVPSLADGANLQERWTSMSIDLWRTRRATNPLSQVIDQMFEQTFVPYGKAGLADGGSTGFQSLPVNVWESDDGYHVALLAPGLDPQTVDVTFHDDTLAIEGMLAFQATEGAKVIWQEFNPGPSKFRRSLRLGAFVDASKIDAVYRDGFLLLTMPKAEYAKPRQIHVKVTSGNTE